MKSTVKSEKSLLAKRATEFSLRILFLIDALAKTLAMEVIAKQLLRAATSIGANIIEAGGASSRRDFIKFFEIAHKSCLETKYWLYLLQKSGKVSPEKMVGLIEETEELRRMLSSSILTAKGKR